MIACNVFGENLVYLPPNSKLVHERAHVIFPAKLLTYSTKYQIKISPLHETRKNMAIITRARECSDSRYREKKPISSTLLALCAIILCCQVCMLVKMGRRRRRWANFFQIGIVRATYFVTWTKYRGHPNTINKNIRAYHFNILSCIMQSFNFTFLDVNLRLFSHYCD